MPSSFACDWSGPDPHVLYNKGYQHVMNNGTKYATTQSWKGPALMGYHKGLADMYATLPPPVAQLVHLAATYPCLLVSFETPPLSNFTRRSVHMLLSHVVRNKSVRIVLLDGKDDSARRMRVATIRTRNAEPNVVVSNHTGRGEDSNHRDPS